MKTALKHFYKWMTLSPLHKKAKSIIWKSALLVSIIILIILLRVFVFEIYQVKSCSMEKTYYSGDIILVNKLSYGAILPHQPKDIPYVGATADLLKIQALPIDAFEYKRMPNLGGIKRGDILVFRQPKNTSVLIKRCIGLPGDIIQVDGSEIKIPSKNKSITLDISNINLYKDAIVIYEHNSLQIIKGKFLINGESSKEYKFKMDYFYMMGDNRQHSIDSRHWGYLPESCIIGKASLTLYKSNHRKAQNKSS